MTVESAVGIRTVNHWIGGKLAPSRAGRSGVVYNPATGEAAASVDFASAAEVDEAVAGHVRRQFTPLPGGQGCAGLGKARIARSISKSPLTAGSMPACACRWCAARTP